MKILTLTLLLLAAPAVAGDATLFRDDTQVHPECHELVDQVAFLAAIMVAAREEGRTAGCEDGRETKCFAHLFVYKGAEELGRHMTRMIKEQCQDI